jgi:hypothetical protein
MVPVWFFGVCGRESRGADFFGRQGLGGLLGPGELEGK